MHFSTYDQLVDFTESMKGFLARDYIIKLEEVLIKNRKAEFQTIMVKYKVIFLKGLENKLRPYIYSLYFQQLLNFSQLKENVQDSLITNPFDCIGCAGLGSSFSCVVCEDSLGFNTCENCEDGMAVCEECGGDWEEHEECNDCGGEGQQDCYNCDGDGRESCDDCDGAGETQCEICGGETTVICHDCDGAGETECEECEGDGQIICDECGGLEEVDCEECEGMGVVEDDEGEEETCSECEGNGVVECDNCEDGYSEECSNCEASGKIKCGGDCDEEGLVECSECGATGYEECYNCDGEGDLECDECAGWGQEECDLCYGNGNVECSQCDEGYESCFECNGLGGIMCESCRGIGKGICGSQHPLKVKPNKKFIENTPKSKLNYLEVDPKNPLLIANFSLFTPNQSLSFFPKYPYSCRFNIIYNGWNIESTVISFNSKLVIENGNFITPYHLVFQKETPETLRYYLTLSSNNNRVYYTYLNTKNPFINWKEMPWDVKS